MLNNLIIFALYINTDGLSHIRVDSIMKEINIMFEKTFHNIDKDYYQIKTIILPVNNGQETKLECVYPNSQEKTENLMMQVYDELLKNKYDDVSLSNIKTIMRNVKISHLLKKTKDKSL